MNLKSTTDFVLLKTSQGKTTGNIFTPEYKLECIENYAKFLKKPLTLGMFVPCDENDKPVLIEYDSMVQKVFFKGFKFIREKDDSWLFEFNGVPFHIAKNKEVERLLMYSIEFELTESALKQIGL